MKRFWQNKGKVIGGAILALTLFCSSLPPVAAAEQAGEKGLVQEKLLQQNKEEGYKIAAIKEIAYDLAQLNDAELAAALKVFRSMRIAQALYIEDASSEKMLLGATKGLMNSLGDPHSIYMDPKLYKELMLETKGSFGGTGIVIGIKEKVLTVVAPIEGTPGEAAGILSGDQILKIDGQETSEMALDEAVNKIRGPEGSKVTLTIRRGSLEMKDYLITRATIKIKNVSAKMLEEKIGYIRISMFNEKTGDDLAEKLSELKGKGMKALVLDLRNNPGGLLDEGVKAAEFFVPHGPIVSVVTKDGSRRNFTSQRDAERYPLIVLVNGGSASASEILAGAIQDTKSGLLLGTKTYGKGSVQKVIPLDQDSAVKVTIAKYFTPNGRSINGIGLEPDVKVEFPERKADDKEAFKDIQLDEALKLLREKI